MKKLLLILALLTGMNLFAAEIHWVPSYKEALALSKKEKKPIIFVMKKHGCQFCEKLERETFSNPIVINEINKNFIPYKVMADEPSACVPYMLAVYTNGFPTIWFLNSDGKVLMGVDPQTKKDYIFKIPGFVDAKVMIEILKDAQKSYEKNITFGGH